MSRDTKIIDEDYLAYIRTLGCLVCYSKPVDPDHLRARGWEEFKRNDYCAIPLCRRHHTERGQVGDQKFCAKYQIRNLWEENFYILSDYLKLQRTLTVMDAASKEE
jgi:hypothetical protein